METKSVVTSERKYKPFDKTFKLCAIFLAAALLYPNRNNIRKRIVILTSTIILNGGQIFWFITYICKCAYNLDINNLARNVTLAVIVLLFFIKSYYGITKTKNFALILDKISEDLIKANNLKQQYQQVYNNFINQCKVGEILWLITPIILSAQFPIYSGILMSIESLKSDNFTIRMVHDMDLLFAEDIQSETPFFQCMFAYNVVQCIVLVPNYCGFDGSFCIASTHLRLKLKLMIVKALDIFNSARDRYELRRKMSEIIKEHQDALDFYDQINDFYGTWLFFVFMLTSLLISFNLYQLHLLQRIDPRYALFLIFGVIHIFVPCHYASVLFQTGEEIPNELYCLPWEDWADPVVTNLLIFMIARSQKSLILTGNGIIVFNMELFKSILQTSYSFFTLITA